jgi:CMP/dCMP kinase
VITFDGPAASGKSTVAKRVAAALGWPFVSSGLLYRAATGLVLRAGADPDDADAIVATLRRHVVMLTPGLAGDVLEIDGVDAAASVQTHDVDRVVSRVARHPRVRAWVFERLREMPVPFVIDGRDMGSVVFPHALAKFYLNAPPDVRAARRRGERGADLAEITAALRRRDEADAEQLRPAPDAIHVDTGPLTLEEVVGLVLARLEA